MTEITTALTTAIGTIAGDALGVFGDVLPSALTIVGAVLVVTLGVRMFKTIAKR